MKKIRTVGVIGLGYVGLPLSLAFAEKGHAVIGFDIDESKIAVLIKGKSYIKHIGEERIKKVVDLKKLIVTTNFEAISKVDAVIICVPTPLNKYREPDLSFVVSTIDRILPFLCKGQVISLESSTYPGTTEEELRTKIESKGMVIGEDIYLVYSPEREDPGNTIYHTQNIPKVVGGSTPACLDAGVSLYKLIIEKVVPVSSTKAAELTKLLENIFRAVNIGLVNEMKMIADKMGIDIWEVINAAATKPFGYTPFYPGPGLGGHCIPIDPFYLTWKAREFSIHTRFIELAGEINTAMPRWVIEKTVESLNLRGKPIKNSRIIVLGLSYKKNIDDIRESPSVELLEILREKEADFGYFDPYFPSFPKMREHSFDLKATSFTANNIAETDCIIISTDHDIFDYDLILNNAKLIIDTRGRYKTKLVNVVQA